ncbi:hypothetical protein PVAND_015919 [Polypedilum vanderplanki]|uniref:Elongation of very long chain fatty acids protein n=1 Tax=Polypedilum vanderplanki TaxID=319348 RepID=A0A9J6BED3_POLVA|nr:hypothetical protein PVAND_015919 [Polypedilum vanderplanki]
MTSLIIKNIFDYFNYLESLSDPRPKGWFMVDSPFPTLFWLFMYFLMVWIGPKIMQNRKPFKIRKFLAFYSFSLAVQSFYISYKYITAAYRLNYNLYCELSVPLWTPDDMQIVKTTWILYMTKLVELSDTLFFILRKKDKQLSFLHVYHHSITFFSAWIGIKFIPSGTIATGAAVNSLVHVHMYIYYGLAALGVEAKKILWLKKYVTTLQLIQFVAFAFFGIKAYFIGCKFPSLMIKFFCINVLLFCVLFGQFYVKEYIKDCRTTKNESKNK